MASVAELDDNLQCVYVQMCQVWGCVSSINHDRIHTKRLNLEYHFSTATNDQVIFPHSLTKLTRLACICSSWTCSASRHMMLMRISSSSRLPDTTRLLSNCTEQMGEKSSLLTYYNLQEHTCSRHDAQSVYTLSKTEMYSLYGGLPFGNSSDLRGNWLATIALMLFLCRGESTKQ